ncbi:hypothetical protein JCM8097_003804 [Rhodosporidiobolus ruineniae]
MKRPPVGAAPAEIVAPISLRRVKPGSTLAVPPPAPRPPSRAKQEFAAPASKKKDKGKGKARERERVDATQGGTEAGPSRMREAAPPRLAPGGGARPAARDTRLLKLANLCSWVLVDNKAVPLYAVKADGPMKMTCLIESTLDHEFAIGFRDERDPGGDKTPDLLCEVVVDGVVCSSDRQIIRAFRSPEQFKSRGWISQRSYTWRGRSESATSLRPFVFSALPLTSDADTATQFTEQGLKALGSVELRVYRGRVGEKSDAEWAGEGQGGEIGGKTVWEESKKVQMGVAHQAGLGPAIPHLQSARSSFHFVPTEWNDTPDKPWVVFGFKYRDRVALEIDGHITVPDTPAPAPTPSSSSARHANPAPTPAKPNPLLDRLDCKPSTLAQAKARTESPALLGLHSPSSSPPAAPPERLRPAPALAKKGNGTGKGKEREREREVKVEKLGEMVLDSSEEEEEEGRVKPLLSTAAKGKAKLLPPPARQPLPSPAAPPKKADPKEEDIDAELARLRAEVAEYKRREVEQLRRERERLKARVEGAASSSSLSSSVATAAEGAVVLSSDGPAEVERAKREEEQEEREVAGQLLPPKRPGLKRKRLSEETREKVPVKKEKREEEVLRRRRQQQQHSLEQDQQQRAHGAAAALGHPSANHEEQATRHLWQRLSLPPLDCYHSQHSTGHWRNLPVTLTSS